MSQRIKELRKKKNMTLLQLAQTIGVSEGTVQRYESGIIPNIKYDTIVALANALDTSPSYLMGWSNADANEYSSITEQISNINMLIESLRNDSSNSVKFDDNGIFFQNQVDPEYDLELLLDELYETLAIFLSEHNVRTNSIKVSIDDDELILLDQYNKLNGKGKSKISSYISDLIASNLYIDAE